MPKVYVVQLLRRTISPHRAQAQEDCGGYVASITNEEEYQTVLALIDATLGSDHDGVWLGAFQSKTSNQEGGNESEFQWRDGATPFYAKWAEGQPDNRLDEFNGGRMRGQHALLLNSDGLMQDESASDLFRPAVFLLPSDYDTNPVYEDCLTDTLLTGS